MYQPDSFRVDDPDLLKSFIAKYPFAQVISVHASEPFVTHLPLLLDGPPTNGGRLIGHLARANPQWKHADRNNVLAVFTGPHAYVSSSWYETPQSVPTWNYTTVHVRGELCVVEDRSEMKKIVNRLVEVMEAGSDSPWSMDDAGSELIDNLLGGIVGFEIRISHVEGKFKLSQNHSRERQERVIEQLSHRSDEASQQMAAMMRKEMPS